MKTFLIITTQGATHIKGNNAQEAINNLIARDENTATPTTPESIISLTTLEN